MLLFAIFLNLLKDASQLLVRRSVLVKHDYLLLCDLMKEMASCVGKHRSKEQDYLECSLFSLLVKQCQNFCVRFFLVEID